MAGNDFIANGKTDAASAVFRAALEKLVLDKGKLVLGDSAATVAYGYYNLVNINLQLNVNGFSVAAVLCSIVKKIEKYLFESLGVAGNEGNLIVGSIVVNLDARLMHEVSVVKQRVLKLGGDIDKLDS